MAQQHQSRRRSPQSAHSINLHKDNLTEENPRRTHTGVTHKLFSEAVHAYNRFEGKLEQYARSLPGDVFRILICGSARLKRTHPSCLAVREFSRKAAGHGIDIVTGGGPSMMEAANLGAFLGHKEAAKKGESIGVTLRLPTEHPNRWCKAISTEDFLCRLRIMGSLGLGTVGDDGGMGTLLELAYALRINEATAGLNPTRDAGYMRFMAHRQKSAQAGYLPQVWALNEWKDVFLAFEAMGKEEGFRIRKEFHKVGLQFGDHHTALGEILSERNKWLVARDFKNDPGENSEVIRQHLNDTLACNTRYDTAMRMIAEDLPLYYRVAILGSSRYEPASARYHQAGNLSLALTSAGLDVVTSGTTGISAAVLAGARAGKFSSNARATALHLDHPHNPVGEKSDRLFRARNVAHEADMMSALASSYVVFPGGLGTLFQLCYPLQLNQMASASLQGRGEWRQQLAVRNIAVQKARYTPKIWVVGGWNRFFETFVSYGVKKETLRQNELSDAGLRMVEDPAQLPLLIMQDREEWRAKLAKSSLAPLS